MFDKLMMSLNCYLCSNFEILQTFVVNLDCIELEKLIVGLVVFDRDNMYAKIEIY